MRHLSPREARFVDSYLETCDIGAAAIAAGYSANGAASAGNRLMRRDRVRDRLKALQDQLAAKYSYSRERKLGELEEIIKDASKGDYPNYAAILKAQEMICKMLGFFEPENQEINNYDVNISVMDGNAHPPGTPPSVPTPIPPFLEIDGGDV